MNRIGEVNSLLEKKLDELIKFCPSINIEFREGRKWTFFSFETDSQFSYNLVNNTDWVYGETLDNVINKAYAIMEAVNAKTN